MYLHDEYVDAKCSHEAISCAEDSFPPSPVNFPDEEEELLGAAALAAVPEILMLDYVKAAKKYLSSKAAQNQVVPPRSTNCVNSQSNVCVDFLPSDELEQPVEAAAIISSVDSVSTEQPIEAADNYVSSSVDIVFVPTEVEQTAEVTIIISIDEEIAIPAGDITDVLVHNVECNTDEAVEVSEEPTESSQCNPIVVSNVSTLTSSENEEDIVHDLPIPRVARVPPPRYANVRVEKVLPPMYTNLSVNKPKDFQAWKKRIGLGGTSRAKEKAKDFQAWKKRIGITNNRKNEQTNALSTELIETQVSVLVKNDQGKKNRIKNNVWCCTRKRTNEEPIRLEVRGQSQSLLPPPPEYDTRSASPRLQPAVHGPSLYPALPMEPKISRLQSPYSFGFPRNPAYYPYPFPLSPTPSRNGYDAYHMQH